MTPPKLSTLPSIVKYVACSTILLLLPFYAVRVRADSTDGKTGSATRRPGREVDSLTRLSKQLGSTLIESAHVGEEVIVAGAKKTIDVMGHGTFYKHPQFKMSEFFTSIKEHLTSAATFTAIDLKGASKQQITEITAYVDKLDKALRDKVIYIHP